jgi:hypothetical protein
MRSPFELVLGFRDCVATGAISMKRVRLSGTFSGWYPLFSIHVHVPQLAFDRHVDVVGAQQLPTGFDGIASFRFLNRFAYGNFGDPTLFGLEI